MVAEGILMNKIPFTKMNGAGNDFIVFDNRDGILDNLDLKAFVKKICDRRFSLGADGVLVLENSKIADFSMRYFNSDGSEAEMCGNGARCIARFAYLKGVAKEKMIFETKAGLYEAEVVEDRVRVKFPDVDLSKIQLDQSYKFSEELEKYHFATVGVPHTVFYVDDFSNLTHEKIVELGRKVRYCTEIFPKGANVNFVKVIDENTIAVRTYERGVEDETYACGTGAVSCAIVSTLLGKVKPPVVVKVLGGTLKVHFKIEGQKTTEIFLEGDARVVAEGYILPDGWSW
ncbi:diaminopimelate epimerase [Pseudothermotoga thermarum]|uniref:Diaminopimelate epimerase n=1 Tax=Pseudothermotoga thermarum DSM 5069 TaxID=688269 RepID=F7YTV2_9THEM|nr:diaminopimelate epimerase [Pseudothermotoga thermarum]AEH51397.1 diaminopimelate epimerase [Pseudothermotoga thermarum DSM 5069]